MTIRPLGPADAEAMAALHATAFDRPWSAADFVELLRTTGALAFGVPAFELPADGALDGLILVRSLAGEAEILTLAVRPGARRGGLGRALVAAGAEAAAAQAQAIWLEAAEDNDAAIALYRAAGFSEAGRRRGYYARPDGPAADALVMRRTLNSGLRRGYSP